MPVMKTPGVYIVEQNAFPNSVVEVATAVPAFIGYTEQADDRGKPLQLVPRRITSMAEFTRLYGGAPKSTFSIVEATGQDKPAVSVGGKGYKLVQTAGERRLLYRGMLHFFLNGGGPCFVVSVGKHGDPVAADALMKGVDELVKESEPTMVVMPDAVLLDSVGTLATVQQHALRHCGYVMKSRFALLDIYQGDQRREDNNCIENFRNQLGVDFLDWGAAYYPWVNTTLVQDRDVHYGQIANLDQLVSLVLAELRLPADGNITDQRLKAQWDAVQLLTKDWAAASDAPADEAARKDWVATHRAMVDKSLVAMSQVYRDIRTEIRAQLGLMPPSSAMAGVYTTVDNTRGVWKAPANVTVAGAVSPAVNLSAADQEDLNVTPQGKSINAIRAFIGEGVLVWGARTLDGNSLDWRYVNVRRTMIMLEESCRLAAKALVFEPNVVNTWVTIKSMIANFLTSVWKRGGLAGAKAEDAFSVHCGLGETMTPEDILEGILKVTVLVAVTRPAEFIEITFQQQMQKS